MASPFMHALLLQGREQVKGRDTLLSLFNLPHLTFF